MHHHHSPYMKPEDVYHQPFASASGRGGVYKRVVLFMLLAFAGFTLFGLGRYYEHNQGFPCGSCCMGKAHGAGGVHQPHHKSCPQHANGLNHLESMQKEHFGKGNHKGSHRDKTVHESTARPNYLLNNPPKLTKSMGLHPAIVAE